MQLVHHGGSLDLNLLPVFDAVMRERNVRRAGQRIGLSSSAVSHALSRLRGLLKDELFVRTSAGMVPTSRAIEIAPLIRDALVAAERAVGPSEFSPATSQRQFCIAATDYVTAVLLPDVLRSFSELAPGSNLIVLPATRIDLTAQIDVGRVDAAIGSFSSIPHRLRADLLFEDRDVGIVAPDHPFAGKTVSLEDLSLLPLYAVSAGGTDEGLLFERGLTRRIEMFDRTALEGAFAAAKKSPNFKLIQPHFLALPNLLAGTTAVAVAPLPLANLFRDAGVASVCELPWRAPVHAVQMVWHQRHTRERGHMWLRELIQAAAGRIRSASS